MIFSYGDYAVFIATREKNDNKFNATNGLDIIHLTHMIINGNIKTMSHEQNKFLDSFYADMLPERELIPNRGICIKIKMMDNQPRLNISYIYTGDNTDAPLLLGITKLTPYPVIKSIEDFLCDVCFSSNQIEIELECLTDVIY